MVRENVTYHPGGVLTVTALDNSKLVAICSDCYEFATNEEPVVPVEPHNRVAPLVRFCYFKDKVPAENVAKSTHCSTHKDAEGSTPYDSDLPNVVTSKLPDEPNL